MTASIDSPRLSSEFGSGRGGWDAKGRITRESIPITPEAVDAVITIPAAQATAIDIQLNRADGSPITKVQDFDLFVVSLTNGDISALATTGGSTGIAADTNNGFTGATVVAKKWFRVFTSAAGKFTCTWTDNAAETAYLAVRLPGGRIVISSALPTS